jgi:predicted RNase H-like HicB family nuclease
MKLQYTYWQGKNGFLVGYLNDWPDHWTQGKDLAELEEMLLDLYEIKLEEEQDAFVEKKVGFLEVATS